MTEKDNRNFTAAVRFAGLKADEAPPAVAVYQTDPTGRAIKKLGLVEKGQLDIKAEWSKIGIVALGPDVDDITTLTSAALVPYRLDTTTPIWREHGLTLRRDLWQGFLSETVCVGGTAKKCRPWWWDRVEQIDALAGFNLSRSITLRPLADRLELHPLIPAHCVPLCDGIVEIYERVCCCTHIHLPDIFARLRDILEFVPVPIPDPIPDRYPTGPWPPGPGPDPGPIWSNVTGGPISLGHLATSRVGAAGPTKSLSARAQAAQLRKRIAVTPPDSVAMPSERLYQDYVALAGMNSADALQYVIARPYLCGLICSCSSRKVGETPLQPGGRFDFCYSRPIVLYFIGPTCHTSFAFKIRQKINGSWVTVYDGVASHDWFDQGAPADLHTSNWRAQVCGSGSGDPPPSDGPLPFVLLEYVGSPGTRHINFPEQSAASQVVGPLTASSGTYTTGYAVDCPWGSSLGLRLWVSPEMEGIAKYYRISAIPVNDTGSPSGAPTYLDAAVSWSRWVFVGGDWVTTSELLSANPADVGGQPGLIRIPYWSGGNYWLSSLYHQVWNSSLFAHGKYLLVVELFDSTAARIKPNGAPGPESAKAFQFRRWNPTDATKSKNVLFGDLAHVFWIDNVVVHGSITDIRKNGIASTEECQFISGPDATTVSIGFSAYHINGVSKPNDSFMQRYDLTWQRGLKGPSGSFASGTADVGEFGAVPSDPLTIAQLLAPSPPDFLIHQKCTFSVHLAVAAKHFNGSSRISGYDYNESASFAVSIDPA